MEAANTNTENISNAKRPAAAVPMMVVKKKKKKISFEEPAKKEPCKAAEAVTIRIVRGEGATHSFHPTFTHQQFGEAETIAGYRDLAVNLNVSSDMLHFHVNVQFKEKDDDADDVVAKIKDWLPEECIASSSEEFAARMKELALGVPVGDKVCEYSAKAAPGAAGKEVAGKSDYVIYRSTPKQMRQQFLCMQSLPYWLIDGASQIDLDDPKWTVYTLYEKWHKADEVSTVQYAVAGYVTVFSFATPFRGGGGCVQRICQALVLPPYQRSGHGKRLINQVYDEAIEDAQVHEITVEDPSPGFCALRDCIDLIRCDSHGLFSAAPGKDASEGRGTSKLSPADVKHVQKLTKLTTGQVRRCYEAMKFRFIDISDEAQYKSYRLEVKRSLLSTRSEELGHLIEDASTAAQGLTELPKGLTHLTKTEALSHLSQLHQGLGGGGGAGGTGGGGSAEDQEAKKKAFAKQKRKEVLETWYRELEAQYTAALRSAKMLQKPTTK